MQTPIFRTILNATLALWFVAATAGPLGAQPIPDRIVTHTTVWQNPKAHPGEQRTLAVVLQIHEGFHINPDLGRLEDDMLIATALEVDQAAPDLTVQPALYPQPHGVTVGPVDQPRQVLGYEQQVVLFVPVQVADNATAGSKPLTLALTFQACDATRCLAPETVSVETALQVVDPSVAIDSAPASDLFEPLASLQDGDNRSVRFDLFGWTFSIHIASWFGLALLLGVSALGGLLLNFTPCVLPVVPLKIMGLSQSAGHRGRCLALGLAMSGGVVAFWLVLGGLIAAVKGFSATNQLFQYPLFTVAVGVLISVMALGMFNLITVRLPRGVYAFDPKHDTLGGSFAMGVMTAVLSTPCTAPFMGAAAAWAAGQHPGTTLATFFAIGAGMATPYLVLSAYPALVERLPRTGPASELIKQVMGLLLLAAGTYFLGVGLTGLISRDPASATPMLLYWWPVMGFVAAAGGWLAFATLRITRSATKRVVFVGLGAVMVCGSLYGGVRLTDTGPIDWVAYSPERFNAALEDDKVVVLEFTAAWCLNCKWLEKNVLHQPAVVDLLDQDDVVAMKVDLTGRNEAGKQMLASVDRVTIPLLVVFAPDGREVFKSDFYRSGQIIEAVDRARSATGH